MTTNKGGRPKLEFDKEQFEEMCRIQCTKDEICAVFGGIDEKTLTRWCKDTYGMGFSDIYKIKAIDGKKSLRRKQYEVALDGNVSMLIWLGKQDLGQRDKQEVDQTITQTPVKIVQDVE
jgi:hypothetical protein